MDAISSQISLKDINLRKFALFCLRSLLSPEFSVAFRVIFLFISSWSFSFPLQVLRMCSNVWPSSFVVYSYLTVMQMNALAFAHSASLCQSCSGYRSQACAVGSFVLGWLGRESDIIYGVFALGLFFFQKKKSSDFLTDRKMLPWWIVYFKVGWRNEGHDRNYVEFHQPSHFQLSFSSFSFPPFHFHACISRALALQGSLGPISPCSLFL